MNDTIQQPSEAKRGVMPLLITWIALFAFTIMFSRPSTIAPVSVLGVFTLLGGSALIKERPEMRSTALVMMGIATLFLLFIFIHTMYLGVTLRNLFAIEASPLFITLFYPLAFLNSAAFMAIGLGLFKQISTLKGALITLFISAALFAALFFGIRTLIDTFIVVKVKYLFVPELYQSIHRLL